LYKVCKSHINILNSIISFFVVVEIYRKVAFWGSKISSGKSFRSLRVVDPKVLSNVRRKKQFIPIIKYMFGTAI